MNARCLTLEEVAEKILASVQRMSEDQKAEIRLALDKAFPHREAR